METVETKDGAQYINQQQHTTGANLLYGPAIAHDRKLSFMLMWIKGPELQYRMGHGGLTSPTSGGVDWEQSIETNKLNVFPSGSAPTGSPALAYGNGHWVVVFARGNQLSVSRTGDDVTSSWEPPVQVMHQDVSGSRPAVVDGSPSMAFVRAVHGDPNVRTSGRFVLIYRDPNLGVVSAISQDGLSWSATSAVWPGVWWEKSPALTEATDSDNWGMFYALLARSVSGTGAASGQRNFLFSSVDGVSWQAVGDTAGYRPAAPLPADPTIVYGGTEVAGCGQPRTLSPIGRTGQCYLLTIEAGAMASGLTEISQRRLATFSLCRPTASTYTANFSPHASIAASVQVGHLSARPAATNGWTQEEFCP